MFALVFAAIFGAEPAPAAPKEQYSAVTQEMVRRLDGRVVLCNVQRVLAGHPSRIGKSVVIQEIKGDPWGFLNTWNAERARRGMAPVSYDGNLSAWAELNNGPQLAARCSGHYVNPNCWQIAFFLWEPSVTSAMNGFLASPGHASVLLDPAIRTAGIALNTDGSGYAWSINARR